MKHTRRGFFFSALGAAALGGAIRRGFEPPGMRFCKSAHFYPTAFAAEMNRIVQVRAEIIFLAPRAVWVGSGTKWERLDSWVPLPYAPKAES